MDELAPDSGCFEMDYRSTLRSGYIFLGASRSKCGIQTNDILYLIADPHGAKVSRGETSAGFSRGPAEETGSLATLRQRKEFFHFIWRHRKVVREPKLLLKSLMARAFWVMPRKSGLVRK